MAYDQIQGSIPDFGFLPANFNGDVQSFFTDNNGSGSQKWYKPRGVTMCYMVCIGGGGGGGGGLTGATTTARGGGAGGACSSIAKLLTPAIFLPDVLLIQVGAGGAGGGGSGINGGGGGNSYIGYGISAATDISAIPNVILAANNAGGNNAGGGNAGTTSGAATGGTVPSISTAAVSGAAISYGVPFFIVGLVGAAGGTPTAAGSAITGAWNLVCLTGGTGGAGVTAVNTGFSGGALSLQAAIDLPDLSLVAANIGKGGLTGGSVAAGNGNAGIQLWKPFYMTGGTGGGSSDGSTGGNGGKGGIGCGGGGGGAGVTGGAGGNGGDGFVCIISW